MELLTQKIGHSLAGSLIGRMANPGSEAATIRWLRGRTALGELLGEDFDAIGTCQRL